MRICQHPSNCQYPVFGTDKNTGIGYCKAHQWSRTDKDKRTIGQKFLDKMKEGKGEEPKQQSELDLWFEDIANRVIKPKPYCWGCGEFIAEKYYRAAIAHIFPKSIFHSIQTHELNFLILGAGCGCHHDTHRLDTFSKMPIFPLAIKRFKEFQPLITETHKYLDEFKKYAGALLTLPLT